MASFVSANDLASEREKRKDDRRKARKEILAEAKESFLKEKKRRELREERGDDKWIAPGIEKRLEYSNEKKKKKKKHKKENKKHKESSPSKSDDDDHVWLEKSQPVDDHDGATPTTSTEQEGVVIQRQEWMTMPLGASVGMKRRLEESVIAIEEEEKKKKEATIGQHPLELNPYWKNGGRGLPDQSNSSSSATVTGDGGRSWLLRSYKRALERSEDEGTSMEEIAKQRWGSLQNLYSLLEEADIDPNDPDSVKGKKRSYLYVSREKESRSSAHSRRHHQREKPSFEPFKSSRGFMKPGGGDSSSSAPPTWSTTTINNSWQKKDLSLTSAIHHLHRSESPPPESTSTTPPTTITPPVTPPPVSLVTDAQLNSLGAKLMKAEMIGDKIKIEKLKKKLEELREIQKSQKDVKSQLKKQESGSNKKEEEDVLITTTDRFGHVRPMKQPSSSGSRHAPRHTHTEKGKRNKYFADDDRYSLRDLLEQERTSTAEDTHLAIAKMASKFVPSRNSDETVDDVLDNKTLSKDNSQREEKKAHLRAITETRAMNEALASCKLCVDNESFEKHLMVAIGLEVYLAIPAHQPLTEGHCLLVPRQHTPCSLQMDENVWSEVAIFRKGLTKMFADRGMDVVFMEMYANIRSKRHMSIECVPLPRETGELAPMYFKKAIMEGDVEWSDNKKLIDTRTKGVRGSLPKGLPYFFVEFGTDGGYGHVIEDQSKFPWYFGREVCGGMLDSEPRLWLKPQKDSFERQKMRVLQLSAWWKDYDWTQKLNEHQ